MKKLLIGSLLALSYATYGVSINVTNVTCNTAQTPQAACDLLEAELDNVLNEDLPDVSIGDYGSGIANAQGFTYRGLGSDYADVFDYFMVRGGVGVSVEGELDNIEKASGFGVGAALTAGINLDILPIDKVGPIELEKLDIFLSFMSYAPDQDLDGSSFKGDISAFSIMARYQILEGVDFVPGNMLSWGGVFLHTGFQRSSVEADVTQSFKDENIDVGGGQTATLGNSSATFSFETTNTTIPIEVATYLRGAWAFTIFGGAGFDLVTGSTDISLAASGTASGQGAGSGFSADIEANESASGDADATNGRAFVGLQFNLPFVRVYTQLNKGLGNDLIGGHAGLKILW